jgi:polyhydroxyalkanoate synthesis regulator protein
MMQGLMGNYMEQSKDLFVKMQKQMQNSPTIFSGFPFPAQANKTEKE